MDLSGADLPGVELAGADLNGFNLDGANLIGADLSQASLFSASLQGTRLENAVLPGAVLTNATATGAHFNLANMTGAVLKEADLSDAQMNEAQMSACDLTKATLAGATLPKVDLSGATLVDADARHALLRGARLHQAKCEGINLAGADLKGADLSNADLHRANLREGPAPEGPPRKKKDGEEGAVQADLEGAILRRIDLRGTNLSHLDFSGADFSGANLEGAVLTWSLLRGADLSGTNLGQADLRDADLFGANLDAGTVMRRARVKNCKIDRHSLESLDDYGGLTPGDRMIMDISDGVVVLRSHYSGFWQWIHLLALIVFIFPYVWFVFAKWTSAQFGAGDIGHGVKVVLHEAMPEMVDEPEKKHVPEIPLWEALLRYIYAGGHPGPVHEHVEGETDCPAVDPAPAMLTLEDGTQRPPTEAELEAFRPGWRTGWCIAPLAFSLFCFSFIYNLMRLVMLWKTKNLELRQEATGLPVPFSTLGVWGALLKSMTIGFIINVVVVLMHSYHFLQEPIPLR
jgi:uncharacterized protein YjbI with pentapeptide repeats